MILKVQASENVVVWTLWKKGMFENHIYQASESFAVNIGKFFSR